MGLKGNKEDSLQAPHSSWHVFELLWRCWLSAVLNPVRDPRFWYQKGDIFQGSSLVLPIHRSSWWGDLRGNTLMSTNKECTRGSLLRKLLFYPSVTFHVSGHREPSCTRRSGSSSGRTSPSSQSFSAPRLESDCSDQCPVLLGRGRLKSPVSKYQNSREPRESPFKEINMI